MLWCGQAHILPAAESFSRNSPQLERKPPFLRLCPLPWPRSQIQWLVDSRMWKPGPLASVQDSLRACPSSAASLGVGRGLCCDFISLISPSAQSCLPHSPTGAVPECIPQWITCMQISEFQSLSLGKSDLYHSSQNHLDFSPLPPQ